MVKRKKLLAFILALVLVAICSAPVLADHPGRGIGKGLEKKIEKVFEKYERTITKYLIMEKNKIKVRNKHIDFDVPPVIKEGRTLIPVRAITQGLGAEVDWNQKNKIVIIKKGDIEIKFDLQNGEVFINGKKSEIDVPPGLINSRVFVPLRFIAEIFGERVDYNPDNDEINIGDEVGDIRGYVTNVKTDDGIKDVTVQVFSDDTLIKRTKTGDDGQYSFTDLPIGKYTLEFSHDDYKTERSSVTVKEDRILRLNISMTSDEIEEGSIYGKVTIEDSRTGIEDVYVRVYQDDKLIKRTRTDDDGRYSFTDLPNGKYTLEFSHEDYEKEKSRVTVKEDQEVKLDISMTLKEIERGSIYGKVTIEGSRTGIEDVYVRVYQDDKLIKRTRTDDDGRYSFTDLPNGKYTLEFSHKDYITVTKVVTVEKDEDITIRVSMEEK